jgi:RES domain-containing protein
MEELDFKYFRGLVYRATTYDTPLLVWPNTRPGRFNDPADRTIAQYCSLDPAAAIAEMVRHENLRDPSDARHLRTNIWQMRIGEGAVVDLSSPARAGAQGIEWESLVDEGWALCQEVGREIQGANGRGIVSPSAALPGSYSFTLFGARSQIAWEASPSLGIQIPARLVMRSHPGKDLVNSVRFFGDPYPGHVELPELAQVLGAGLS